MAVALRSSVARVPWAVALLLQIIAAFLVHTQAEEYIACFETHQVAVNVLHFGLRGGPSGRQWQAFGNFSEFVAYSRTLPAWTPMMTTLLTPADHALGQFNFNFVMRAGTTDLDLVLQHICICHLCELRDGQLEMPLHEVQTVLDLGGNIGISAILFSQLFPNARIVSVEPGTSNFQALTLNTRKLNNVQTIFGAVWSHDDYITFKFPQVDSDWGTMVGPLSTDLPKVGDVVAAYSMETLMAKAMFKSIDILKVDIEGTEQVIFKSASTCAWLRNVKCIVMEWHPNIVPAEAEVRYKAIMAAYHFHQIIPEHPSEFQVWCKPYHSFGLRAAASELVEVQRLAGGIKTGEVGAV